MILGKETMDPLCPRVTARTIFGRVGSRKENIKPQQIQKHMPRSMLDAG
jgi:hypothetical protein